MFDLFLLSAAAVAAPAAELPNFEFRGVVAGTTVAEPKTFGRCGRGEVDGLRVCTASADRGYTYLSSAFEVAGRPLLFLTADLYQARLSLVYGTFKSVSFLPLAEAFTAKYGAPCETSEREWQSVGGVKTTSSNLTWCFATGKLTLEQIGEKLGDGRFTYTDEWQAPKPAPKVDF